MCLFVCVYLTKVLPWLFFTASGDSCFCLKTTMDASIVVVLLVLALPGSRAEITVMVNRECRMCSCLFRRRIYESWGGVGYKEGVLILEVMMDPQYGLPHIASPI